MYLYLSIFISISQIVYVYLDLYIWLCVCAPSEKLSAVEIEFSEHGQAQLPVSQMISLNGI